MDNRKQVLGRETMQLKNRKKGSCINDDDRMGLSDDIGFVAKYGSSGGVIVVGSWPRPL
ncbi:hypothetical protein J6590_086762 [Homalodisca vitripennis]|nr:hypothetical protein J6590_086762 [Homalodisca vitripennis]